MSYIDKLKIGNTLYDIRSEVDGTLSENGVPADAKAVGDALTNVTDVFASTETVTNNISNPTTVYPYDGDITATFASNSSKVGLVAIDGKNFLPRIDDKSLYGIDITQDDDGTIHIDGTVGSSSMQILWDCVIPAYGCNLAISLNNDFANSGVALIFQNESGSTKVTFGATALNRQYTWSNNQHNFLSFGVKFTDLNGTTFNDVTLKPMICIDGAYNTYEAPSAIFNITTGETATLASVASGSKVYATTSGTLSYTQMLQKYVSELRGKTWYCLGDSITYNEGNYESLIAESDGIIPTNAGVAGTGYLRTVGSSQNFATRSASISDTYDIVTVMGSINDINEIANIGTATDTGTDTIGGCINATIDNIYASGNYHLGLISPTPTGTYNGNPKNGENTHVARIVALEKEICKLRGVPYLDLFHSSNLQPWDASFLATYMNDETHPNAEGYKIFSNAIKQFIKAL